MIIFALVQLVVLAIILVTYFILNRFNRADIAPRRRAIAINNTNPIHLPNLKNSKLAKAKQGVFRDTAKEYFFMLLSALVAVAGTISIMLSVHTGNVIKVFTAVLLVALLYNIYNLIIYSYNRKVNQCYKLAGD